MAKTVGLKFLSTHQQKNSSSTMFVYNKVGMVEAGLPSLGGFGPSHLRPDNGIAGVKCFMKANHFFVDLLDMDLHDYDVTITPEVACAAKEAKLLMFSSERQAGAAKEALLQALLTTRYCALGRSFYSPDIGGTLSLGKGLESRIGFYQRIRSTQMGLSLSIDMSFTTFMEPLPVIDFVMQLLKRNGSSRFLYSADRLKIEKALSGVEVEVLYRGKIHSKYRIFGLTSQATQDLTFAVDDIGTMKSVVEYFQETYELVLEHIQWPCLLVGNRQRPTYLPMEVCKIVEGQRYFPSLDESQITALRNFTGQRAQDRQDDILKVIHAYTEDPYLKEFGIKISENLVSVEARILPAPLLKYHETGREKDCLPKVGQWNMREKKMVNAGAVNSWICINFSSLWQSTINLFCYYLGKMCHTLGMAFNPYPVLPLLGINSSSPLVASALKDQVRNAKTKLQGKELDLLIVILPNDSGKQDSLYGEVKRICETELGIVSQCCLHNHVDTIKRQYLENLALKINVKVGGRNTVLVDALSRRLPLVSEHPAIIFGADVNHPRPGEDSSSPSIAAVVASQDWPEMTKYASLVSVQPHQQELILDLFKSWQDPVRGSVTGGMIKELLISFYRATGHKPQRIIFYRGGVSESQLYLVLLYELDAIHEACASIETNYQPPVTFVVVQKRHNTRLFADNHADLNSVDSSRNILPGTVVDSKICHPTEFDFYLCSDGGIQDTSCPTHYHVLCDENKFTADELQSLTNNLCYTYATGTRSVSIVPPVYYAQLAARRTRVYTETKTIGLPVSSTNTHAVRPLFAVKENLKGVMYYC